MLELRRNLKYSVYIAEYIIFIFPFLQLSTSQLVLSCRIKNLENVLSLIIFLANLIHSDSHKQRSHVTLQTIKDDDMAANHTSYDKFVTKCPQEIHK